MMRLATMAIGVAVIASLSVGCAKKIHYVQLSEAWPAKPGDYDRVYAEWTRHGKIMSGWDKVLAMHATFKSPEWRTAYVAERTKRQRLRAKDRLELLKKHKADAARFYEVELLMSTYQANENDLHRGKRSMWRIWLIDGAGKQVEPISIKRDKRPRGVIDQFFRDFSDFDQAYIVRFPRTIDVLKAGGKQFSLRMASAHGAVEVTWLETR